MILHVLAVFDNASGAFMRPIFVPAIGLAVRSFTDEVNRSTADNALFHHAADFALFNLGVFDDNAGVFTLLAKAERVVTGADVKAATPL